jgi:hypothetical protein
MAKAFLLRIIWKMAFKNIMPAATKKNTRAERNSFYAAVSGSSVGKLRSVIALRQLQKMPHIPLPRKTTPI